MFVGIEVGGCTSDSSLKKKQGHEQPSNETETLRNFFDTCAYSKQVDINWADMSMSVGCGSI